MKNEVKPKIKIMKTIFKMISVKALVIIALLSLSSCDNNDVDPFGFHSKILHSTDMAVLMHHQTGDKCDRELK